MVSDPVRIALLGVPSPRLAALGQAVMRHLDPRHAMVDACPVLHAAVWQCVQTPADETATHAARQALASLAATHGDTCVLTLLDGLQAPAVWMRATATPGYPALPSPQEPFDACLREALSTAGVAYRVLYGNEEERLRIALNAIKTIAPYAVDIAADAVFASNDLPPRARLRAWSCEKCSDPECEHKLFTALRG